MIDADAEKSLDAHLSPPHETVNQTQRPPSRRPVTSVD